MSVCTLDGDIRTHNLIPAWLSSTGDAGIHHIIGNQEVGLKLNNKTSSVNPAHVSGYHTHQLDAPPQQSGLEVLLLGQI